MIRTSQAVSATGAVAAARSVGSRLFVASAGGRDETIPPTFLAMCDLAALVAAFVATGYLAPSVQWLLLPSGPLGLPVAVWRHVINPTTGQFPPMTDVVWVLAFTAPATLLFMELLGGYRQLVYQSSTRLLISGVLSPLIALSFITFALFALRISSESRVLIFTFGGLSVLALAGYRGAWRLYKKRRLAAGEYAKNVVLVGHSAAIDWMSEHFRRTVPINRYRLTGWLSVPSGMRSVSARHPDSTAVEGSPGTPGSVSLERLGNAEDLGTLLIHAPIDEVIVVQSADNSGWLKRVIEDCDYFRIRLRIVPETLLVGTLRDLKLVFRTEPLRLPEVVLEPPHLATDALLLKRLIDIGLAATLLVVLSPLLALIAIAIKVSSRKQNVLYSWHVVGLKGRPFTGYKFTTMVADADEKRSELVSRNEMQGPVFKLKHDPRVTRLGRILRKYSLNELPQLWSVLKGDMSLVGPRPAFRHELDRYELWHKRKLCVKPGITCLWQVNGRNQISNFDDWVRLDLEYIDQWSLWLDFRILARTAWAVVAGTGS